MELCCSIAIGRDDAKLGNNWAEKSSSKLKVIQGTEVADDAQSHTYFDSDNECSVGKK